MPSVLSEKHPFREYISESYKNRICAKKIKMLNLSYMGERILRIHREEHRSNLEAIDTKLFITG